MQHGNEQPARVCCSLMHPGAIYRHAANLMALFSRTLGIKSVVDVGGIFADVEGKLLCLETGFRSFRRERACFALCAGQRQRYHKLRLRRFHG